MLSGTGPYFNLDNALFSSILKSYKGAFQMLKICALCGKGAQTGRSVVRKGLAKKKGGTGSKIVRSTKRWFFPNLHKIRILIDNLPKKVYVCTKCIKKGDLIKA
jgi:large subunit ribosomal protein L28